MCVNIDANNNFFQLLNKLLFNNNFYALIDKTYMDIKTLDLNMKTKIKFKRVRKTESTILPNPFLPSH